MTRRENHVLGAVALASAVALTAWAIPSQAYFIGPASATQGVAYVYEGFTSDPDALLADVMRFHYEWGDGTVTDHDITSPTNASFVSQVSKTWNTTGTFTAYVTATNLRTGQVSLPSDSKFVTVAVPPPPNQPPATPAAPQGPATLRRNKTAAYTAVTTDPDGNQIRYTFDWGDGQTTTTGLYASGATASASHAWSARGTFAVRVKAADTPGAASGWSAPCSVQVK